MTISRLLRIDAAALLFAIAMAGCTNPVLDDTIEALGGEAPGVEPSQYHRPGQPCLACHGPYGGATPEMSVGGTIFAVPTSGEEEPAPVGEVIVTLTDAFGDKKTKTTNCAGNFHFTAEEWQPGFPLEAKIEYPTPGGSGTTARYMSTRISREGSCNTCHQGERSQSSPGWAYCLEQGPNPFPPPEKACPGVAQ